MREIISKKICKKCLNYLCTYWNKYVWHFCELTRGCNFKDIDKEIQRLEQEIKVKQGGRDLHLNPCKVRYTADTGKSVHAPLAGHPSDSEKCFIRSFMVKKVKKR